MPRNLVVITLSILMIVIGIIAATHGKSALAEASANDERSTGALLTEESLFGLGGAMPIVFQSNRDGNQEIYRMNADGTSQTRITNNPAADSFPAWSPDGTKIAFESNRDGNNEIYVMNQDGSNPMRITNNSAFDGQPAWAPDGSRFAFCTNRDGNAEIYVMNIDGTNPIRLTDSNRTDCSPSWSPDGTRIAFTSHLGNQGNIVLMNADGSNQMNLASSGVGRREERPNWSPDGTKIVFASHRRFDSPEICVVNTDGTDLTFLTTTINTNPKYSPDGSKIVFLRRSAPPGLHVMNANGSNPMALTSATFPVVDDWPDWRSLGGTPTPTPTSTPTATPTSTPTATPTPGGGGFESDVSPRMSGDGIVITGDVVQMRRFATGLDTPNASPNEFQRGDSAPRATLGDGAIASGDVTQARRYATGLDPLTAAGGPTAPAMAASGLTEWLDDAFNTLARRELLIGSALPDGDGAVTVPIELVSMGDEVALSFTLEYDASVLSDPQVRLAESTPADAVLTVNMTEDGRIGILVDSTQALTMSDASTPVIFVTFHVWPKATHETPIALSGSLAPLSVADAYGNSLAFRYRDPVKPAQ